MSLNSFGPDRLQFCLEDYQERDYDRDRLNKMYSYPCEYDAAIMHKQATKFGYHTKNMKNGEPAPLCPCCETPINTTKIDLCYETTPSKDIVKVGQKRYMLDSGSAMFFTFIKMCIVYLLLRFLLTDGFNVITSLMAYCTDKKSEFCGKNFFAKSSIYNKI